MGRNNWHFFHISRTMKNFNALIYVRNVKAMKGLSLMFIMSANTSLTYSLYKCLASPINSDLFFFLSKKNKIAYPVHMTQFIKLDQVKFVPVVIACHILITCHCSITSWLMWRKIEFIQSILTFWYWSPHHIMVCKIQGTKRRKIKSKYYLQIKEKQHRIEVLHKFTLVWRRKCHQVVPLHIQNSNRTC
jgi:hypothetical protein